MCDTIAGQLLVCFDDADTAGHALIDDIRNGNIPHVSVLESLESRLARFHLKPRSSLGFRFFRLEVPPGEEAFKINYLQFFYKHAVLAAIARRDLPDHVLSYSNLHFHVSPHFVLSVADVAARRREQTAFTFDERHARNREALRMAPGRHGQGRRVLILDTGVDDLEAYNVRGGVNFVGPGQKDDLTDDHGHGTAIASIVHDLGPAAELVVYKVADAEGRASEWDTLAGLAADSGADVVNMSLAFGLRGRTCAACGRQSTASRSGVFEAMLAQLERVEHRPIVVAAAGNDAERRLAFPARFASVLAAVAIDSAGRIARFSNRSNRTQEDRVHENVFVLPGGETEPDGTASEYVGRSGDGTLHWGTSMASAYATGVLAALWASDAHAHATSAELLAVLRDRAAADARRSLPGFATETHGNGRLLYA